MKNIVLRGHHLLCTRLFIGNGYDEEFAKRMGEVVTKMELDNFSDENKYEKTDMITLVCKSDYVCEKCPNRVENIKNNIEKNNKRENHKNEILKENEESSKERNILKEYKCKLGDKDVLQKDRLVLKYLGLEENKSYTLDEIKGLVRNIKREQFEEICGGCRWNKAGYCSYEKL